MRFAKPREEVQMTDTRTGPRAELEKAKIKILKTSAVWNLYRDNFGEKYAEEHTMLTRKMLDDDLKAIRTLESELGDEPDN